MGQLIVRCLDGSLIQALKQRAARSAEAKHRAILEQALVAEVDSFEDACARLRARTPPQKTDAADLIRQDRDRDHRHGSVREAVVEASVAAKWVVEENHSVEAVLLLHWDARHAPDHWRAEAVNVLWAKVLPGYLTAADAEERMSLLLRAPVFNTPIALLPRAFAISAANAVTVYDSLYIALAEKRNIPLVTADERLIRRMSGDAGLAKLIVWVGDLSDRP